MLQNLNPAVGINNLVEVNSDPKLDLQNLLKSANPPDVLENVHGDTQQQVAERGGDVEQTEAQ
jgi:hypothetical protein